MINKKNITIICFVLCLFIICIFTIINSKKSRIQYKNPVLYEYASFKQLIPLLKDYYSEKKQNVNDNISIFFSKYAEKQSSKLFTTLPNLSSQISKDNVQIYLLLPSKLPKNQAVHILAYSNIIYGKNWKKIMVLSYGNGKFKELLVDPSLISNVYPDAWNNEDIVNLYYISKNLDSSKKLGKSDSKL